MKENYHFRNFHKIIIKFILLIIIKIVVSCGKENQVKDYNSIIFDKTIKENEIYKNLDDSLEFDFGYRFLVIEPKQKRSNNLIINTDLGGIKNTYREFNSESFFISSFNQHKTDTLLILINNFDGYSGKGLNIKKYKSQYKIEFSEPSDVVIQNNKKDDIKIIESQLILDKKTQNINDSVFGYVKLKMIKNKESIDAQGFFRTRVKERKF